MTVVVKDQVWIAFDNMHQKMLHEVLDYMEGNSLGKNNQSIIQNLRTQMEEFKEDEDNLLWLDQLTVQVLPDFILEYFRNNLDDWFPHPCRVELLRELDNAAVELYSEASRRGLDKHGQLCTGDFKRY